MVTVRQESLFLTVCHKKETSHSKKADGMKIVWRNPNPIDRKGPSIARTASVERAGKVLVFYRSLFGLGALGTIFELLVNRPAVSHAAEREVLASSVGCPITNPCSRINQTTKWSIRKSVLRRSISESRTQVMARDVDVLRIELTGV